jgi:peptidylprolyl isomerase
MGKLFNLLAAGLVLAFAVPAFAQDAENILVIDVAAAAGDGVIEIELLADLAPNHVARLKELARAGTYDNVVFHRVIAGFMAQTGDVQYGKLDTFAEGGAGTGGSTLPNLVAEFSQEPFVTGILGMARAGDPDSANSQFFIMTAPYPSLDGQYTVVGRVVSGQEVVDRIKLGNQDANGVVESEPDFMRSIKVKADM